MKANTLKCIPLMQCFDDQELVSIAKMGELKTYPAHTNVVIEGELSWGLYLIVSGEVEVSRSNKLDGVSYHIAHLREGNFFGELSLIDQNARSATVKSTRELKVFSLEKEKFEKFLKQDPARNIKFLASTLTFIVSRLRELDDHFIVAQYQLWSRALKGGKDQVA